MFEPDIVVHDRKGNLVMIVEVKRKWGTSQKWAIEIISHILKNEYVLQAPYFLLALPDRFYLWKKQSEGYNPEPDYEIDATLILQPYFESAKVDPKQITPDGFELLLTIWLRDWLIVKDMVDLPEEDAKWFIESGLYELAQDGWAGLGVTA
jgi:hypothetical protein